MNGSSSRMQITMVAGPEPGIVRMRIEGDVDLLEPRDVALSRRCLSLIPPGATVHVDLAGMTFGGSALIHYLYALARRSGPGALHVHGAHGVIRTVIGHARLSEVAVIHEVAGGARGPDAEPDLLVAVG